MLVIRIVFYRSSEGRDLILRIRFYPREISRSWYATDGMLSGSESLEKKQFPHFSQRLLKLGPEVRRSSVIHRFQRNAVGATHSSLGYPSLRLVRKTAFYLFTY